MITVKTANAVSMVHIRIAASILKIMGNMFYPIPNATVKFWKTEAELKNILGRKTMIKDSVDRTEFETGAKRDIYDFLRFAATISEKLADVLNAIAECSEKVTACFMDLFEEIKRQPLKMILQKLRPDYKDKCKIRWLDIPNKVMQGRIRRFC